MLNQEEIYKLIFAKNWNKILDYLYKEKENIKRDALLLHASKTFVTEFLRDVENYNITDEETIETLQILNVLHFGKFYTLTEEEHKRVVRQLIKRSSLTVAYSYAKYYPDDEECAKVIEEYYKLEKKQKNVSHKTDNFSSELFNRLFELINNNNNDPATYFSGPRFINTVRSFLPYYPTYAQFIEERNDLGKSTSRKIYYYDILKELDNDIREKVIYRILEITKPFEKENVEIIERILKGNDYEIENPKIINHDTQIDKIPIVFISYSWDNEEHKKWVLDLANKLSNKGVKVILDRYYLRPGVNLPHFVDENIDKADKIIMIFTPNYKLKADKRTGGVGYEYSILNFKLYRDIANNGKIIPLLRNGSLDESIPEFMQQFIHIDARKDENIDNNFNDLLREIFNEPEIKIPNIGQKPKF